MRKVNSFVRLTFAAICLIGTVVLTGCQSTADEPENMSSRPWGYRSGYDPGLPSMLNEGR